MEETFLIRRCFKPFNRQNKQHFIYILKCMSSDELPYIKSSDFAMDNTSWRQSFVTGFER